MSNSKMKRVAAVLAATLLAGAVPASAAAVDYFLRIDGVEGESKDDRHKGEIDIESWSWGASSTSQAGGARAGKPCVSPMTFTKLVDKASPVLMANAVSGMAIPKATLKGRKSGERQQEYLTIELKNVLISSYQSGGSSSALPVDQFSLNFASMTVEYRVQNADGSLGAPVSATFQGGC